MSKTDKPVRTTGRRAARRGKERRVLGFLIQNDGELDEPRGRIYRDKRKCLKRTFQKSHVNGVTDFGGTEQIEIV